MVKYLRKEEANAIYDFPSDFNLYEQEEVKYKKI